MATVEEDIDFSEQEAFQEEVADTFRAMGILAEPGDVPSEPAPADTVTDPDEMTAHEREHYEAIREKEGYVRDLERNYLALKRECKDAKDSFEEADRELRDLISRGPDRQRKLPLATDEPQAAPVVVNDAWRTAPLSELALPAGVLSKLEEANVTNIGQLEDLRAEIANAQAVWPKGIGEAKITLIEERMITWLSEHRDSWGQPIEEAEGE